MLVLRSRFRYFFVGLCLFLLLGRPEASVVPPDVLAKNTTNEVLAIVKKDKDIQAGDWKKIYDLVDAKILPHFDFARMTQLAVGKNWAKASASQRQSLIREFRTLLVRTYASSLSAFANTEVSFKPVRMNPEDTDVTVRMEVKLPGSQPVTIDYQMEKTNDGWKVYDVAVDAVSLVTNYRSSFAQEVRKSGIDGLIDVLAKRNKSSLSGAASQNCCPADGK
jgi:phospholipid transport system substrate-binding protein